MIVWKEEKSKKKLTPSKIHQKIIFEMLKVNHEKNKIQPSRFIEKKS